MVGLNAEKSYVLGGQSKNDCTHKEFTLYHILLEQTTLVDIMSGVLKSVTTGRHADSMDMNLHSDNGLLRDTRRGGGVSANNLYVQLSCV